MTTLYLEHVPQSIESRIRMYYETDRYVRLNKGDEVIFTAIIYFKEGDELKFTELGVSGVVTKVRKWFSFATATYFCELLPESVKLIADRIRILDMQDDSNIKLQ